MFLAGMALLQAWPGRGFWPGTAAGQPGNLASMVQGMAQTSQPGFLSSWVNGFGTFAAAHGFAVNLIVVVALAAAGLALASGQRAVLRPAVGLLLVLCAADWVLVQDLGVFGGLGTDPNSMLPFALVAVGGYLAVACAPASAGAPAAADAPAPASAGAADAPAPASAGAADAPAPAGPAQPARPAGERRGWRAWARPRLASLIGDASPRTLGAVGGLGVAVIGVIPLATASASASASPILAQALDGSNAQLDFKAPGFTLTNQNGHPVSLDSLHGKVVLLTFLDPVCTSDCPLIAQEFRQADQLLGGRSRQVELVAVVTNPVYNQPEYTAAFDRQEHMNTLPNWQYLTGSVAQLKQVWRQYGIAAQILPAGGMIGHSDIGVVLSGGRAVWVSGPGAAWRTLPGLPAKASSAPDGGATLAAAPGGGFEALSARGSQLSVWSLSSRGSGWSRSQVMNVAIPYGSSG